MPVLRNPVIGSVQNAVRKQYVVIACKRIDHFVQNLTLPAHRQALDVLEDEVSRPQFQDKSNKMMYERIARIVEGALANQGKTLARGSAEYHCNLRSVYACKTENIAPGDIAYVPTDRFTIRKIKFVRCAMNRVDFDSGRYIEAGALETQAQSSSPCKKIYPDRPHGASCTLK